MTAQTSKQVRLSKRPQGRPTLEDFEIVETPLVNMCPSTDDAGKILVEVEALSLDPYMRARMEMRESYAAPMPLGAVVPGWSVARVLSSSHKDFVQGDLVAAETGWQSHALISATAIRPLPAAVTQGLVPASYALGILGMPGLTAYAGVHEVAAVQPGDTLVVAAAAGPVGSTAAQLARLAGARVVGITSGPSKAKTTKQLYGYDTVLDRTSATFSEDLSEACPNGIDVYLELVGGEVFKSVLPLLNRGARIPVIGLVGQWQMASSAPSAFDLLRTMLDKSLTMQGFVVREFEHLRPAFERSVAQSLIDGDMVAREHSSYGLESAPSLFIDMLEGRTHGKAVVKLAS